MKRTGWFGLLAGVAVTVTGMAAETTPAENREGLFSSESLAPFGVSLGYREQERGIEPVGWDGSDLLKNRAYVGELSFRPWTWFEVFGTAGSVETRDPLGGYGDGSALYSGGVRVRLWHCDIEDPELLAGRYSVMGSAEYLHSEFDFGDGLTGDYQEMTASLRLGWEIFVDKIESADRSPYSLLLTVGPVYSSIEGSFAGGRGEDFNEEQSFGVEAGAELYLHHKLSAGFSYLMFDEGSYRADLRWRFYTDGTFARTGAELQKGRLGPPLLLVPDAAGQSLPGTATTSSAGALTAPFSKSWAEGERARLYSGDC